MNEQVLSYAEKVKELRLSARLSQYDISKKFKFTSCQYVSNVERGLCYYTDNIIKPLSKILKTDPKYLLKIKYEEQLQKAIDNLK